MPTHNPVRRVCLISLAPVEGAAFLIKASALRITLKVLQRSLEDLVDVEMYPTVDMEKTDFICGMGQIARDPTDQSTLIAISVMSNDYPLLREVSSFLRKEAPAVPIVSGGPHFVDRYKAGGSLVKDDSTAVRALREGLVDIVAIGEGSPLRELVLGIQKGDLRFDKNGNGFVLQCRRGGIPRGIRSRSSDGQIQGEGAGSIPHIVYGNPYVIPVRYKEGVGANYTSSNFCPNRCDYCGSPKTMFKLGIETYFEELDRTAPGEEIVVLQANDNHPFEAKNRWKTLQLLNAFAGRQKKSPKLLNFFIDPSTLLEKNMDTLWGFFANLEGDGHQFQFGRECTDEHVCLSLGRHYYGKPRTQQRLDAEREVIAQLAQKLPQSRFKVFYILTPFESEGSVLGTVREAESLSRIGNIYTGSNFLWPLPGSPNRAKYKGRYFSFEDIPLDLANKLKLVTPVDLNFWHPGFPGSDFLDYMMGTGIKLYVEPTMPNNTMLHLTMMRTLASIAFGTYKPGETILGLVETLPTRPAQRPGDIEIDFVERLVDLGKRIDHEGLYDCSLRSKIRLSQLVRERFWFWDEAKLAKFVEEFEGIDEFRRSYFRV